MLFRLQRLTYSRRMGANMARTMPATCVTFLVYENLKSILK